MFTFCISVILLNILKTLREKMTTQSSSLQMSLDIFHFNVIKVINTTLQAFINCFLFYIPLTDSLFSDSHLSPHLSTHSLIPTSSVPYSLRKAQASYGHQESNSISTCLKPSTSHYIQAGQDNPA